MFLNSSLDSNRVSGFMAEWFLTVKTALPKTGLKHKNALKYDIHISINNYVTYYLYSAFEWLLLVGGGLLNIHYY